MSSLGITWFRAELDSSRRTYCKLKTDRSNSTRYLSFGSHSYTVLKNHLLGFVETIKGEGMPIFQGSDFGDLYVEYKVVLPTEISPEIQKSEPMFFLPHLICLITL